MDIKLFTAPAWCTACKDSKKLLQTITNSPIKEIDIDNSDGLKEAQVYGLKSVPSVVVLENDIALYSGPLNLDAIKAVL